MNRLKVKILIDDESLDERYEKEHGLSILIEHSSGYVLFDTGKTSKFIDNARTMKVDLSSVKHVVLSHGHYDHTGGLKAFLEINKHAKIYFQKNGTKERFSQKADGRMSYIGIDKELVLGSRVIYPGLQYEINESLILFSGVSGTRSIPSINQSLFQMTNKGLERDDFSDEQNLIIIDNGKYILISGCSHKGILNIIDRAEEIIQRQIDIVIGGFHLFSFSKGAIENERTIQSIVDYFKNKKTKIYTMHCTGMKPYGILKEALHTQIEYIASGSEIHI